MKLRNIILCLMVIIFFCACGSKKKDYSESFKKKFANGKYLFIKGDLKGSLKVFNETIEEESHFIPARLMKVKCLFYLKQYEQSFNEVVVLEKQTTDNSVVGYWKAKLLRTFGKIDQSLEILEDLANEDPFQFKVFYELASIYHEKKNYKEAIRNYYQALALEPLMINARLDIIEMYRELKFDDKANKLLEDLSKPYNEIIEDSVIKQRIKEIESKLKKQ